MTPTEFEPALPANERPQTHALGLAANGTSLIKIPSRNALFSAKKFVFSLYSY
jgi:hypothetical protein